MFETQLICICKRGKRLCLFLVFLYAILISSSKKVRSFSNLSPYHWLRVPVSFFITVTLQWSVLCAGAVYPFHPRGGMTVMKRAVVTSPGPPWPRKDRSALQGAQSFSVLAWQNTHAHSGQQGCLIHSYTGKRVRRQVNNKFLQHLPTPVCVAIEINTLQGVKNTPKKPRWVIYTFNLFFCMFTYSFDPFVKVV